MKAILTTLCGCAREFETSYPPPPSIMVPLNRDESNRGWLHHAPQDPVAVMRTREFRLTRPMPRHPGEPALYVEHGA